MKKYEKYAKFYSDESFWTKLSVYATKAGIKVVYLSLLLYYMLVDELIDMKSKVTIVAALGYFIFPLDVIPDLLPAIGFTDDLSVLILTLSILKKKINDTHRQKAIDTLEQWFKGVSKMQLLAVEKVNFG